MPWALMKRSSILLPEDQAVYKTIPQMEKGIAKIKKDMEKAARDLDFMEAARLRDEMFKMQRELGGDEIETSEYT
jgi:excinuclease UvrABC helicase subunit UvrB